MDTGEETSARGVVAPSGSSRPGGARHRLSKERGSTWLGRLAFAAAVAALFGALVLLRFPEVLHGALIDTDSYMRLVRVRRLVETGAWFDLTIPRSNAPYGSSLHWTRPVDVLLLIGAWLTTPLFGFGRALHLAGVVFSPLLLIAICFTVAWAVRPLAGGRMHGYAMLAVLAQLGIMSYALPGRADHNMPLMLAFVAMVGSALHLMMEPRARRYGWAAGAWAALGLWISTEFLVPLLMLLVALAGAWIVRGREVAHGARSTALGLLAVTAVAVLLEHAPSQLLLVEYDRISVVHGLLAVLVIAFWMPAASNWSERLGPRGRGVYAAAGALSAAVLLLVTYPRFFGGPMVDVHPELKRTWLPYLTEFQPYLVPHGLAGVGRIFAYLGHAILALGVVIHGLRRERDTRRVSAWILVGAGLALFLPLGVRWVRFVGYAEMLGVIGAVVLLGRVLERVERSPPRMGRSRARVLASSGILVGPLFLGAIVMALGGERGRIVQEAAATQTDACPVEALVSALNDVTGLGARPRTVLAHIDLGPVLLYRTSHAVVATPYHRNWRGILDWQTIVATRDPEQARALLAERGVDLVVPCGTGAPRQRAAAEGPPAFADRLDSGAVPEWLHPAEGIEPAAGFRIYEIATGIGAQGA